MPTKTKTKPVKKPVKPAKAKMMMTLDQADDLGAMLGGLQRVVWPRAATIVSHGRAAKDLAKRMVSVANALLKHAGAR